MVPIFIKYSLAINNMWVLYKILRSSSSSSFLFLECVWLTEKALNPDKSDYTNFIFTSETQSRQKQTKKQTKQKQNRSNI